MRGLRPVSDNFFTDLYGCSSVLTNSGKAILKSDLVNIYTTKYDMATANVRTKHAIEYSGDIFGRLRPSTCTVHASHQVHILTIPIFFNRSVPY